VYTSYKLRQCPWRQARLAAALANTPAAVGARAAVAAHVPAAGLAGVEAENARAALVKVALGPRALLGGGGGIARLGRGELELV
jgi:hypothetical protein